MPLYGRYISSDVEISVWEMTESIEELSAGVDNSLLVEAQAFSGIERRAEWLAVRKLLKMVLGDAARIVYDSDGKPSLEGGGAHISISHTRGYVALAVSHSCPVGLDVELLSREVGAVSRRFMRDDELAGVPAELENSVKLLRWTASEAVYKLVGNLGGSYRENIVLDVAMPLRENGVLQLSLVGLRRGNGLFGVSYLFAGPLLLVVCQEAAAEPLRAVDV
ncbi:MAG: 4'-phosphopantetheinyl transferase superfamily protein [Bacteroidales bacterium]|nr:4'-phosphopantetheinyl transferase superfamily protein [Bacteroidales bacterium]